MSPEVGRIGNALPQRTRCGFHTGRFAIFRMTGRLGVQLSEILQLIHGQVVAGQVQKGIQQHGAVPV